MSDNEDEMSEQDLLQTLRALSQQSQDLPQALRGLLSQLGPDLPIFGLNHKYSEVLERINPSKPIPVQMSGLSDLCEMLSMASEEMLLIAGFDVGSFITTLANLIQNPATIEVLMLASRALAGILDIFTAPQVIKLTMEQNVVAILCEKLLNIEYMDVAEIALRMLERIANSQVEGVRAAILEENALVAVLQFVDFFPTDVQRGAARTAALLSSAVTSSTWIKAEAALPLLVNLIKSYDAQIVASGCEALQRLCDNSCLQQDPSLIDTLVDEELLTYLITQFCTYTQDRHPDTMALSTYATLLRIMTAICQLKESMTIVSNKSVADVLAAMLSDAQIQPSLLDAALLFVGALFLIPEPTPAYIVQVSSFVDSLVPLMLTSYELSYEVKYLVMLHVLIKFLAEAVLKHDRLLCKFVGSCLLRQDTTEIALSLVIIELAMQHKQDIFLATFVRDGVVEVLKKIATSDDNAHHEKAQELLSKYFTSTGMSDTLLSELMWIADHITEEEAWERLQAVFQKDKMTIFELRTSGLVAAIVNASAITPVQFDLWKDFGEVVQDAVSGELHTLSVQSRADLGSNTMPILAMVELLGQHLKMRLYVKPESDTKPFDAVVLVEPLARVETLEEFVADKVFGALKSDENVDNEELAFTNTPRKQPRMQAVINDKAVSGEMSILEALVKSRPIDSSFDIKSIWQQPQELIFAPRNTELAEEKYEEVQVASPVWDYLILLRFIRHHSTLPPESFVVPTLSTYVDQYLMNPLLVALNLIPPSCRRIVREFAFSLPLETKLHYLYGTQFGPARALQYLGRNVWKQANVNSAVNRVAKLPRLKVRVARAKLLNSAMKLLESYGGQKAIIEIEYLGEVGTGLGPTTEFFSLVSQEIQAIHLQLWRHDGPPPASRLSIAESATPVHAMPVRGYHRIGVMYCAQCSTVSFPRCESHNVLMTATNTEDDPQCSECHEIPSLACPSCPDSKPEWLWWIVSNDEIAYLARAYPRHKKSVMHPVLKCSHCNTVSFPGTDAGIVVMDGDRMVSRSGRRMYERDYRAVTKHVSALCEGTPLKQTNVRLCRNAVDVLAQHGPSTPEVLDTQIDGLGIDASFTNEVDVVNAPFGLYPQPIAHLPLEVQTSVLEWFNFLGKFVAQALVDERLLDLPFALPFVRALTGESLLPDTPTALKHVSAIDPDIGRSLTFLYTHQDDASIDDMGLTFVLMGNSDVELKENGADIPVTCANVNEYVSLTLEMLLNTSIAQQVAAFRKGFDTIVPEVVLTYFTPSEWLDLISDASTELWPRGAEELKAFMVCDHGYTNESRAIQWLIDILVGFTPEEQRLFVRFVTGSHRLPLGGLSKLDPTLTVVKKLSPDELSNDDDMLPSASTCTNYLKLPDYTSRELMRAKLLYCIHEGQLSFHLS